jgi:chemotaxis protein CheC
MTSISSREKQHIQTLINAGVQQGAEVLNAMLNSPIKLETPILSVVGMEELKKQLKSEYRGTLAGVRMGYAGELSGEVELIFNTAEAARLASAITEDLGPETDLDGLRAATISEVGNVVINAIIGTMSNSLGLHLNFSVPQYMEGEIDTLLQRTEEIKSSMAILVKTRFSINKLDISGHILLFFTLGAFDFFTSRLKDFDLAGQGEP